MQWIFLGVLMKRLKAIKYFMKDKEVPFRKKLIIIFGVIYLLTPIDLIPAPVLGFGFLDDIALWGFIIYYLKDELDKYWLGEDGKEEERKEALKGKDNIEDVDYEIKPDAEEDADRDDASGDDGQGE